MHNKKKEAQITLIIALNFIMYISQCKKKNALCEVHVFCNVLHVSL